MKLLFFFFLSLSAFAQTYKMDILLERDEVIWGLDFLKDGRVIFTERSGGLFIFDPKTKKTIEVSGVPEVSAKGQGGLLDVRVHPESQEIYLTYSETVEKGKSTTALGKGTLKEKTLSFKKIFSAIPASSSNSHYGSRVVFDKKGYLYLSVGERRERELIQKLDNHLGKILRLKLDGSLPQDNPYVGNKSARPEIYSFGHRNPQGLSIRAETGELWEAEMGPRGGDEVNLIRPQGNYGWPEITYGREYTGGKIGAGQRRSDVIEPIVYWTPSISPSGMTFYTGDKIPEWKGNLFLGLLSGRHIRRLVLKDNKLIRQEELFKDKKWRFRQLRTGPDGYLWFSTDNGKLGRILKK